MKNGNNRDTGSEQIFIFVLTVTLIWTTWYLIRVPLMWFSFYTSFYCFKIYEHLPLILTATELNNIVTARKAIASIRPADHGIKSLITLFEYHGYVWRAIVIPMLLWWGWTTKRGIVRFNYKREIRNVYELIEIQAKHFPASAIIRGKNLLKTHPYEGPWATYALPLDFALDHMILWTSKSMVRLDTRVNEETMIPIPSFTSAEKLRPFPVKRKMLPSHRYVCFHVDRANALFSSQMGPLFTGPKALPPLERALYAALCAQAAGKSGECWKMIEQLGFSFQEGQRDASGKLSSPHYANVKGTDELLAKYENHPSVTAVIARHAHVINVMTALLHAARGKGRLMHANFLWLKPVNRGLWYALCGEGGQCPYWEASGPWAHAQIEELMGSKIVVPMVAGAVNELREVMSREHWIDPGKYSEESQKQLVAAANAQLSEELEKTKSSAKNKNPASLYAQSKQATIPPSKKKVENEDD
ncbi:MULTISPECIES: secretion/conjugation apparatus DotM-related subunit [Pseudomonas syringae group]|uniref:DotM C-terminal cytoplasmic domain-containing protein n=1 Tax=Pseudomonas cannabina TaxID=86840 RepID=A0A3M3K1Y4_PSECA|nr:MULTISPECIES: hypothetical protein [Pseudomonas syringae group]MDH4602482.1 hypothetical protein [Pseudomonas syringae pv. papulans]RMN17112.1 hypothetical protein ALQ64_03128 [Pseudomonas cannabina]